MAFEFPDINPVALELGPLVIRWYALAYLAGILLGWKYCIYLVDKYFPNKRPNAEDIGDFVSWAVLGIIVGGRLGYVTFYQPEYYFSNPLDILKVWQGGMSFHGGLTGVAISMFVYCKIRGIEFLRLTDIVACSVPIGLFFGRIANFINGELFGRETNVSWAVIFPEGGAIPRHPSQLYEALLEGIVLFIILFFLVRLKYFRERAGLLTAIFLGGYSAFRAFVEFFREPDFYLGLFWESVSMGQILSLTMIIISIILAYYSIRRFGK